MNESRETHDSFIHTYVQLIHTNSTIVPPMLALCSSRHNALLYDLRYTIHQNQYSVGSSSDSVYSLFTDMLVSTYLLYRPIFVTTCMMYHLSVSRWIKISYFISIMPRTMITTCGEPSINALNTCIMNRQNIVSRPAQEMSVRRHEPTSIKWNAYYAYDRTIQYQHAGLQKVIISQLDNIRQKVMK